MSPTGIRSMDREINVAMEWIVDFDEELAWDDRQDTYQAVRATLHALRDRLTIEEAANLSAQLPTFLRGVYYEGYRPDDMPIRYRKPEEFYDRIRAEFQRQPVVDAARITHAVFSVLSRRISGGEIEDVKGMFPKKFQHLWDGEQAQRPRPS